MTLQQFLAAAEELRESGEQRLRGASTLDELNDIRNHLIGRNSGRINELSKALGALPKERETRAAAGQAFQLTKSRLEEAYEARRAEFEREHAAERPRLDLTMPARPQFRGAKHPVTLVLEEITAIFREIGFTVALGPEAETDWYNFGALNFPPNHPALDAHDTLYLGEGRLLRTHTSPVQIRTLQSYPPPVRVLIPGNVYRRDFFDPSHAPMFAQLEGLAVDDGVTFVDLKATLTHFAKRFFGAVRTRFRPSFFPFTEPSAEMDVECQVCGGSGCPVCKYTGWSEILGCGMVHPRVLEAAGVDGERYTGWAFGMGPGRIAMQRYGLPDIRLLYDSDVRFLEQFAR